MSDTPAVEQGVDRYTVPVHFTVQAESQEEAEEKAQRTINHRDTGELENPIVKTATPQALSPNEEDTDE